MADSESSSLRLLDLRSGGSRRIAGGDAMFADNLFQYGDRDGGGDAPGPGALLQHPLGVAVTPNGVLFIADSYNHKIKRYDPAKGRVESIAGSGRAGLRDGEGSSAQFSEPGGLCAIDDATLLVADTNNSVIRLMDVRDGRGAAKVRTLKLTGVPPVRSRERLRAPARMLRHCRRACGRCAQTLWMQKRARSTWLSGCRTGTT